MDDGRWTTVPPPASLGRGTQEQWKVESDECRKDRWTMDGGMMDDRDDGALVPSGSLVQKLLHKVHKCLDINI